MSLIPTPGEAEHMVLLAILRLEDHAYGVSIRDEIKECTGRDISPGALYTTLDRLEKKNWLKSTTGDPTPERGGRAKRYYTLTKLGLDVLREGQRVLRNLSRGLKILGAENA